MADEARLTKLRQLVELDPDDAFSSYALAMELKGLGRDDEALAQLQALIAAQPGYVASYYQCARLLQDDGEDAAAVDVVERGIQAAEAAGDDHAKAELGDLLDELR